MHEEPVVCSPEDAIRSFLENAIDVLVLQDYICYKN
jgi:predicted NodU family carbamoyl transferase